jgi:ribosomal protein S18 acetylase RimI-like enzyme
MMASAENDPRKAGTIWTVSLDEPNPVVTPLVEVVFGRIGPERIPELVRVMEENSPAELLRRFATGRQCYAGWVAEQMVVYGWVSFKEELIGELRLQLRLHPGEAYIWDCATLPAYRGQYLYSALLGYILRELRAEQLGRVWIGANLDNEPSQRGIARAGFQRIAAVVVSRVFAMRMVWVQGWPGAPEDLVSEARRVFLDNREKVWLAGLASSVRDDSHPRK